MDDQRDEGALVQAVKIRIVGALPKIKDVTANSLAVHLVNEIGLEGIEQMELLTEKDIISSGLLKAISARELLGALATTKEGAGTSTSSRQEEQERLGQDNSRQERHEENFRIDWTDIYKISKDLKTRLLKGKKLKRPQKVEFVRRVVTQVREKAPQANRRIFFSIASAMKKKYPASFSSELANGKLGKHSLGKRMQIRFDNQRRAPRRTTVETEAPAIKAAYGCKQWRLAALPPGQTATTQKAAQDDLKDYFTTRRPHTWDWEYINRMMDLTYGTQRKDINRQAMEIERKKREKRKKKKSQAEEEAEVDDIQLTTTEELRDKWPFLFQPQGMLQHFNRLMKKDLEALLEEFLSSSAQQLTEFLLQALPAEQVKKIKKRLRQIDTSDAKLAAFLQLLVKYFRENETQLWKIVDETAREDDIPTLVDLPKTPCLIIAGKNVYRYQMVYFSTDGTVLGSAQDLKHGITLLFATYYVFNLQYAPELQTTMEFIQRTIADINPDKGNKRPSREECEAAGVQHSTKTIHPLLAHLDEKFIDFLAENEYEPTSEEIDDDD